MSKIEVNLKLFVTCRLCLDETGHYQIDPRVQEQIKYCFDFDVDPFDSLPKLICKKCEEILTQFNEIKKKVQEKQHFLNLKLKSDNVVSTSVQQQDIVSSTQSAASEAEETPKSKSLTLFKKDPETSESTPHENKSYLITNPDKVKPSQGWRRDYNKLFTCRFCSNVYKSKRNLLAHLEKHKEWLQKFTPLLKECIVSIPKLDEQPNITGMKDMVMIEEGKIIQNSNHQYNVYYKLKTINTLDKERKASFDSSDEDIIGNKNRKRLRLMSQSSDESIILDVANRSDVKNYTEITSSSKNKFNDNTIECVDIDSSSGSDTGKPVTKLSAFSSHKAKVVNHIVTSCYTKFIRKDHSPGNYDNSKESQLQHKILSMGRKVINKTGFNCTGLLRYMESKNLNIKWNRKIGKNMDTDYVRISTKLLENQKDDTYAGWKCFNDLEKDGDNVSYNDLLETMLTRSEAFAIVENHTNGLSSDQAQCILTSVEPSLQLRKILNQNPVANPKQIPRKLISPDCTSSAKLVSFSDNTETNEYFHMPVITNTVSLANCGEENNGNGEKKVADNTSKEVETTPAFVPKIKVKPVSELMPDKTTNTSGATAQTSTWNILVNKNNPPPPEHGNTFKRNEWVIMHTVELPNTVTTSPFKYFQSLLQMHNIVLLDTKATISSDFSCLIKFKSVFKQESKRITLCLSLYSDIKQFYIQVTDTSSSIDIMTLTPTWQWEILQLYRSDIVNNVLENAKKISQQMYEATTYFMSILRSIVFNRQNEK